MSKRILSLVLALVMVLGTFGTVFAEVDTTATVNEKIEWLVEQGKLVGDESGNLNLTGTIDRASTAKMIAVALGLETEAAGMQNISTGFKDMSPAHWANGFANLAAGKNLMFGDANNFMPAKDITYAEVATILVRLVLGRDLTAEEKSNAGSWAAPYIARATKEGVLDGVSIVDFNAKAVRETVFEMFYNAMMNMEVGDYSVVRAIVLENDRVESLKENEIVVEIMEEIQRSEYVAKQRNQADKSKDDLRGAQLTLTVDSKYDVEELLGKVARFSVDKAGKIVLVQEDKSYSVVEGKLEAIEDALKVDGKEYTVIKDERVNDQDERVYRTYLNNESMKYNRFGTTRKYDDKDARTADYARVTIKNGKVIFIDAYDFSDIAPVKEVKTKDLVIFNDARDGGDKKIDEPKMILGYNDGTFSRLSLEDVKELNVIHLYETGKKEFAIVRTDASINGEYEKVSFDRKREETLVIVDGTEYEALDVASKRPVVSYNEKDIRTLDVPRADKELADFKDEKVTILVDINTDLQYVGAEIDLGEFMALVQDVLSRDVRLVRTSDEREDYGVNFSTKLYTNNDTKQSELRSFERGHLVYVVTDDQDLSVMAKFDELIEGNIEKDSKDKQIINKNYIKLDKKDENGVDEYRILDRTNVFVVIDGKTVELEGTNMADVLDDLRTPEGTKGLSVEILTDFDFEDSKVTEYSRETTTGKDNVAHTIVFTETPFKNKADEKVAILDRIYSSGRDYEVRVEYADGEVETLKVERSSKAYDALSNKNVKVEDVVTLSLSKGDKEVRNIETKISAKAGVFEVVEEVRHSSGAILKLRDRNRVTEEYFILKDVADFGDLAKGARVSISLDEDRDFDIDAFIVRDEDARITGDHETVRDDVEVEDLEDIVTYINSDKTTMKVNGKNIRINENTELVDSNGKTLAIGSKDMVAKGLLVEGDKVDVDERNNTITLLEVKGDDNNGDNEDEVAAKEVADAINALSEEITLEDKAAVVAARAAYDALTDAQKELVEADVLAVLVAAEAKIAELEGEEPEDPEELTAEAVIASLVGQNAIKITLSDNDEIANVDEVKVGGEVVDHDVVGNEIRVVTKGAAPTEITLVMTDGTVVEVTIK